MLYKNYQIKLWKSEWIGKRIEGEWYCLNGFGYLEIDKWAKRHKYIALVDEINPQRAREIWGGSTPLIALDLAKFSIDLRESNRRSFDIMERVKAFDQKCLKENLKRRLANI
jgi:hypothetical protein